MIRMVALDIDGTLLNSEHEISERNKRIIKEAISKGIKIVLSSGRNFLCMQRYVDELEITEITASLNGAYVLDNDKQETVHDLRIEREVASAIIEYVESKGIHINYYHDDKIVCAKETDFSTFYSFVTGVPIEKVGSLIEYGKNNQPGKLLVIGENEALCKVREWIDENHKGKVNHFFSNPNYLEITHHSVSKGEALKVIAKHYNFGIDEVMAIGDGENDVSMIEAAGIGVAMGNAAEAIKEAADYVTLTNNEDGVAHAIEKFALS